MRSLSDHPLRTGLALLPVVLAACVVHVREEPRYYQPAPAPAPAVVYTEPAPVEVDTFYEPLQAYGEWIEVGDWGRVWRPFPAVVGADFYPYRSGGHWVWTDVGWTFESEWDWGWAPFHYGRWAFEPEVGWVWLPGTTWGPAWVDWRYGGGYVGWVPIGPPGYVYPEHHWTFVETVHFANPHFHAFVVPPERVHTIVVVSAPLSHSGRFHPSQPFGPPRVEIERAYGRPITVVHASSPNVRPGVLPSHNLPPQVRARPIVNHGLTPVETRPVRPMEPLRAQPHVAEPVRPVEAVHPVEPAPVRPQAHPVELRPEPHPQPAHPATPPPASHNKKDKEKEHEGH